MIENSLAFDWIYTLMRPIKILFGNYQKNWKQ